MAKQQNNAEDLHHPPLPYNLCTQRQKSTWYPERYAQSQPNCTEREQYHTCPGDGPFDHEKRISTHLSGMCDPEDEIYVANPGLKKRFC